MVHVTPLLRTNFVLFIILLFNLQQERVKMLICVALPLKIYFKCKMKSGLFLTGKILFTLFKMYFFKAKKNACTHTYIIHIYNALLFTIQ